MKVLILKGLPGSGKSTWAKEYCEKHTDWVRINRDDLRNMRGLYWLPKDEDLISQWEKTAIAEALAYEKNVIVDATNLNPKYLNNLRHMIYQENPSHTIEEKVFDVSPEECIKRDLKRPNSVGADVIWGMYFKYINPVQQYEEDPSLPHCALFDIDGTLAENISRGPFEWSRVKEDKLQDHVASIARMSYDLGRKVIILSGRDSICAEDTADWLVENNVPFHELHMRPMRNMEKDWIIKKRIFDEKIKGKYYVDFVIDDRPQVIRMWYTLGLKVISNNPLNKEF